MPNARLTSPILEYGFVDCPHCHKCSINTLKPGMMKDDNKVQCLECNKSFIAIRLTVKQ